MTPENGAYYKQAQNTVKLDSEILKARESTSGLLETHDVTQLNVRRQFGGILLHNKSK